MIQKEKNKPEGNHLIFHYCYGSYSHSLDACGAIDVPSIPYEGTNLCPKEFTARLGGVNHPKGLCRHSLIPVSKLIRFPLHPHGTGSVSLTRSCANPGSGPAGCGAPADPMAKAVVLR